MGNAGAKKNGDNLFTPEELKLLGATFHGASGPAEKLERDKLQEFWSTVMDPYLAECTTNFLYMVDGKRVHTVEFKRFCEAFYIVDRGTMDEKSNFMAISLDKLDTPTFSLKELEKYVAAVIKTYVNQQQQNGTEAFNSWKAHGYASPERTILAYAKGLVRSLCKPHEEKADRSRLERWMQEKPTFLQIWKEVFICAYSKSSGKAGRLGNAIDPNILPRCEDLAIMPSYVRILDIPHIIFINNNLPHQYRHKWRFIYSSSFMGESFSAFVGKILNKGPTVVIVEDEDRYVFGAYASHSWQVKPQFTGDHSSFLMSLSPAMRCFRATGYNTNYQYMNLNQQTMPNGMGMGGQFDYWGLWIDSDFGVGQSSESCTTYRNYIQLSKRKEFRILHLEVWGVGEEPELEDIENPNVNTDRSVLDHHLQERAILQLSGKEMHSDNL